MRNNENLIIVEAKFKQKLLIIELIIIKQSTNQEPSRRIL